MMLRIQMLKRLHGVEKEGRKAVLSKRDLRDENYCNELINTAMKEFGTR